MGAGKSKATAAAETLNNSMVSIATSTIQNCGAVASQDQLINIRGNRGIVDMRGVTMTQGSTVNLSCALSASNKQTIAANISSMLNNTAAASASLGSAKSRSISSGKITNTVSNAVNNLTTQNLSAAISQNQVIDGENNTGIIMMQGMNISQTAAVVAKGIVDAINATNITTEVANAITNTSDAESKNPIDSIMDGIGKYAVYIVIFIVIIVLVIGGIMLWPSIKSAMADDEEDDGIKIVPVNENERQPSPTYFQSQPTYGESTSYGYESRPTYGESTSYGPQPQETPGYEPAFGFA